RLASQRLSLRGARWRDEAISLKYGCDARGRLLRCARNDCLWFAVGRRLHSRCGDGLTRPGTPFVVEYSKCSASPAWTSGKMACAAIAASANPERMSLSLPG